MTGLGLFCIVWGATMMVITLIGYAKFGFSKLGLFIFLSSLLCFGVGWL